jgi:SAM-dependent methyltransferase
METNYYNKQYFNSAIFEYDYVPVAEAILKQYAPKTVIEFGCGNGELSKALSKAGIAVTAIDGYANPDFGGYDNISFYKIDLNDPTEVGNFLSSQIKTFDVAICMEVAEHLTPAVSESLIDSLTSAADVVIFSAAIPEQDGDGHINCRDRFFWHEQFEKRNFFLKDTIRSQIRDNAAVGRWYALNTVDYVKSSGAPSIQEYRQLVANLVKSESAAASHFYLANRKLEYKNQLLKMDLIWSAYKLRNRIKKFFGKPINPFDKY